MHQRIPVPDRFYRLSVLCPPVAKTVTQSNYVTGPCHPHYGAESSQ